MKTFKILLIVILTVSLLSACGNNKVIQGKERKTIGIINILINDQSLFEQKYPEVQYQIIWGNVIWGIILSETVIVPIYIFGFSIFEPVGLKK